MFPVKDHQYFVYIVCSRSGTLYIGMTNSIYRRALQHKRGEIEGFASITAIVLCTTKAPTTFTKPSDARNN
jgi:predicted GIY-YIG superfamily endonuclease